MTKIDIISGFLGAGKTTLIKKLIDGAFTGEKLVLIENEFGEIGIDGGFLKDAGVQITEMNQGCICCSLVGDFGKALKEVIDTYSPDRIIIEPSGVGKLSDVIKAVLDLGHIDGVVLNSSTTVVDCTKAKMYMKNFGEFFNNQIESAGAVILSRTQIAKEGQVEDCVARIREKNADAAIVTTPWDDIDAAAIVGAMEHTSSVNEMIAQAIKEHEHHHDHDHEEHEHHHHHDHGEDCTCGCHDHDHKGHEHHHHHADDIFTTWGKTTPHKFDRETIETALKAFADTEDYGYIVRSKGIVPANDGTWIYFDLVDGEYEIRTGEADVTGRLVVIGTEVKEAEVEKLFGLA